MTLARELSVSYDIPLSFRYHRRRPRSLVLSNEDGADNTNSSDAVRDVLKRFADRNHYGPKFAEFLDSAYQQQNNSIERYTSPSQEGNEHQPPEDPAPLATSGKPHPSNREKSNEVKDDNEGTRLENKIQHAQSFLVHNVEPNVVGLPILKEDDSDAVEDIWNESKKLLNGMGQTLRRAVGETFGEDETLGDSGPRSELPYPPAAMSRSWRDQLSSADLTEVTSIRTSEAPIDLDFAISALSSTFGPKWTEELLGVLLSYCNLSIADACLLISAHGDDDPKDLIARLKDGEGEDDGLVQGPTKIERPRLQKRQGGRVKNGQWASLWSSMAGERWLLNDITSGPTSVGNGRTDIKNDVPTEVFTAKEREMDDVSLLSCSIAEGASSHNHHERDIDELSLRYEFSLHSGVAEGNSFLDHHGEEGKSNELAHDYCSF